MLLIRWVILLLLLAAAVSFAFYAGTSDKRWLRWGTTIVKWTVIAALGFFAVLIAERLG